MALVFEHVSYTYAPLTKRQIKEGQEPLWALNDKLSAFQKKLNLLHLSIRHYTMTDVWNNVTAGMLDRSNGEVAQMALRRWQKSATFR